MMNRGGFFPSRRVGIGIPLLVTLDRLMTGWIVSWRLWRGWRSSAFGRHLIHAQADSSYGRVEAAHPSTSFWWHGGARRALRSEG